MASIGYIALVLALIAAIYSATAYLLGARGKFPFLTGSARNSAIAVYGLVSISIIVLLYSLVTHDFRLEYVASYTSRDLSLPYLVAALWAGSDGSLLCWAWFLSIFATVAVLQKRSAGKELVPYAASVLMLIEAFFLILLLSVSNPFHELSPVPTVGLGLNPLLENVGMILHPPALLAGYAGLAVPFAFAVAALLTGRLGDDWIAVSRRWMLLVWLLLGVGNMVGAWWAYVELGWGGYWNWDPVENAGLMPWLVATAFLHSALMQRRRGTFRLWNMVLVILAFNLAIFGTFLTRSGFLSSVHTFNESSLGHFFLVFMVFTFLGSLVLLGYRSGVLKSHAGTEAIVSKQSTFLLNNLLMVGVTAAIFIGTIFPVISRGITGATIGVGPSFFNQVVGPTSLAIILLTGICTLIDWRRSSLRELAGNIIWPLAVALALGIALFFSGIGEWYALAAFITGGFTLATVLYKWLQDVRARHRRREENYLRTFKGLMTANRTRYGSYIAHLAIICITIGMVGSSLYSVENTAVLSEGDSMSIKGYSLTYENVEIYEEGSKIVVATSLAVYGRGRLLSRLTPEKHYYWSYPYPVTEIAIRSTLIEDLYVIPVEWSDDGTATFKVIVNPLVAWIWVGGGALMLGGLIVFWPGSSEQNKVSIGSSYQS